MRGKCEPKLKSISHGLFSPQKPLIELIIGGAQVVARAFTRAVQEEFRSSQQAAQKAGGGRQGARRAANDSATGITLQVIDKPSFENLIPTRCIHVLYMKNSKQIQTMKCTVGFCQSEGILADKTLL